MRAKDHLGIVRRIGERSRAVTAEKYRNYIREMLDHITDEKKLRRIYLMVHRIFIHR